MNFSDQTRKFDCSLPAQSRRPAFWLVSFTHYDIGYIDLAQKTLQPLDNPFGASCTHVQVQSVTYVSGLDKIGAGGGTDTAEKLSPVQRPRHQIGKALGLQAISSRKAMDSFSAALGGTGIDDRNACISALPQLRWLRASSVTSQSATNCYRLVH
jgi:hypothetical protein